jgi:hypothetical protein
MRSLAFARRQAGILQSRAGRDAQAPGMLDAVTTETTETTEALTLQFLAFVADGERTYGETMEAWRSTCPRMSIWEDAVRDGLVRIENGGAMKSSRIVLTARGKARLGRNGT